MMKKRGWIFFGLTITIIAALLVAQKWLNSKPTIAAVGVPDTEEARQIMTTIERAYQLFAVADRTFDTSQFPTVFIDDSDVPLSRAELEQLRSWLGTGPEGAGYLTFITAYYADWRDGALRLESAWAKAKAEGRDDLAHDEWMEIVNSSGGRPPAVRRQDPIKKDKLRFDSIDIRGEKAIVLYDDGGALWEATLVRRNGRWYIAGRNPTRVHF